MFTKADAEAYFNGEKQECFLFVVIGIVAIITALLLFFYFKYSWGKGAAWPLLLIGLIQVAVGYAVYARSDAQRKDIVYKMDMNPDALRSEELPRMEKVMKNFVAYRYTEIGLLIVGLVLVMVFRSNPDKQFWLGLGAALAFQAVLMLFADGIAEQRGSRYLDGMKSFLGTIQGKGQ